MINSLFLTWCVRVNVTRWFIQDVLVASCGNQEGFSVFKRFFYALCCYVNSLTLLGSFKVQYLMVHKRFESKCECLL